MDLMTFRALYTLVMFLAFVGVSIWALSKHNHSRFSEAERLPFADEVNPEIKRDQETS